MRTKILLLIAASSASLFFSCGNAGEQHTAAGTTETSIASTAAMDMADAEWLAGIWKMAGSGPDIYEVWQKENDSVYQGKSLMVKGRDTIVQETIELRRDAKDISYIPTVMDQNASRPVPFKLTSWANGTMVFENPGHDFPQMITYKKITPDSLVASISGKMEGNNHTETFPMKRIK